MKRIFICELICCMTLICFACEKSNLEAEPEKQEEILLAKAEIHEELSATSVKSGVSYNENQSDSETPQKQNETIGASGFMGGTFIINDDNVRLRDNYGLNSNIIGKLNTGDSVQCLEYVELIDDSDFQWIYINSQLGKGWIYGEYIFEADIAEYRLNNIEEAGIKTEKGLILSGIKESDLIDILGEPDSTFYDDVYNEDSLYYDDLSFAVNRNFKRVQHITIKSSEYQLANGIKVGDDINKFLDGNEEVSELMNENHYGYQLKNFLRKAVFDAGVVISTDKNGIIKEIQIGFPD